jgi:hypothetical protein
VYGALFEAELVAGGMLLDRTIVAGLKVASSRSGPLALQYRVVLSLILSSLCDVTTLQAGDGNPSTGNEVLYAIPMEGADDGVVHVNEVERGAIGAAGYLQVDGGPPANSAGYLDVRPNGEDAAGDVLYGSGDATYGGDAATYGGDAATYGGDTVYVTVAVSLDVGFDSLKG